MKKRVLAVLAATALVGVASAYAANPFADVPTTSWAYQAVTQLAEQGIVIGYPDGYFKGQRNITRYEMAQIIARAMAKEDRANAEQRAMINKLANEFSTELNNLGVRVSNLEKKVGNVTLTGDAKVEFGQERKGENQPKTETYKARVRVNATGAVDENTWAGARLVANMGFGDAYQPIDTTGLNGDEKESVDTVNKLASKAHNAVTFDRLWVKHKFSNVTLMGGRMGAVLGGGLAYDETLDGVSLSTNFDKVALTVGYGYAKSEMNDQLTYAQLSGTLTDGVDAAVYYGRLHSDKDKKNTNVYGLNLDANLNGVMVGGEWARTGSGDDTDAWTLHVGYGNYDQAKAGTWGVTGKYFDFGKNFKNDYTTYGDVAQSYNMKGWGANVSYALADNLGLEADYYFHQKTHEGKKLGTNLLVALKYQF